MLIIGTFCLGNFQQKLLIVNILLRLCVSAHTYAYMLVKTRLKLWSMVSKGNHQQIMAHSGYNGMQQHYVVPDNAHLLDFPIPMRNIVTFLYFLITQVFKNNDVYPNLTPAILNYCFPLGFKIWGSTVPIVHNKRALWFVIEFWFAG